MAGPKSPRKIQRTPRPGPVKSTDWSAKIRNRKTAWFGQIKPKSKRTGKKG